MSGYQNDQEEFQRRQMYIIMLENYFEAILETLDEVAKAREGTP